MDKQVRKYQISDLYFQMYSQNVPARTLPYMLVVASLFPCILAAPVHPDGQHIEQHYWKRSAMPYPEFWLCTSDFNLLNLIIEQPLMKDRCEVVPRSSSTGDGNQVGQPTIQTYGQKSNKVSKVIQYFWCNTGEIIGFNL